MNKMPNDAPSKYMVQLDGFRFLAVLSVMIGHWFNLNDTIKLILGPAGVNLFFVLSGFLISVILMANKDSGTRPRLLLLRFYIRRFLRIFPLYYLVIFASAVLYIDVSRQYFLWLVTYTVNFIIALSNGKGGTFTHLWSLAVEEQFYIVFPLLILITPKRHYLKVFSTLIILAIISRFVIYFTVGDKVKAFWLSYAFTPCCFDSFAIGAVLAYFYTYDRYRLKTILEHKYYFLIAFVAYLICSVFEAYQITRTFFSVFCFWVVGVAAIGQFRGVMKRYLENNVVIYFGKITYGLYVYHYFMLWLFQKFQIADHWYNPILYFILTVAAASLSWHFFENPLNQLKKHFEYK